MRVKTTGVKCIIYNNPHCYSLWTANLLVSKERGTFCSKAEENRSWHFKRASFSFEFKFNTWGRKAYNSLSSRLPRGKQWTSIVLPDRDHSHFHHCLLHHQESGQHPGSFWMCSDTSPDNIFETGKEFYLLASVFTVLSSCSGIQVRSKVQAVACLQVSPDLMQVGILPSLVPWKWTENVFRRHLENGFRYYYVEWQKDNLWP